jgi:hypothetical protein
VELELLFDHVARQLDAALVGFRKLEGGSSADVWRLDLLQAGQDRPVVLRQHQASGIKAGGRLARRSPG